MRKYIIYKHVIDITCILYCCYETYISRIEHSPYILVLQHVMDMPFASMSLCIHHITNMLCVMDNSDAMIYRIHYSTLILLLYKFSQEFKIHSNVQKVMKVLSVVTFIYFRNINLFNVLTTSPTIYINILYIVNVYWLSLILGKTARVLYYYYPWQKYDSHLYAQYLYVAIPVINVLTFPHDMSWFHVIDIYIVFISAIIYHLYHNNYYESFARRIPIEPDYYFYEKIALQLRSIVGLINVCIFNNVDYGHIIIPISLSLHCQMAYLFYKDYYNNSNAGVFKYQRLIFKVPLFYDALCLYVFADLHVRTVFYTTIFLALCCSYNRTFGKNDDHLLMMPFLMNYLIISQY